MGKPDLALVGRAVLPHPKGRPEMNRVPACIAGILAAGIFLAILQPAQAFFSGDACRECHFSYYGSPKEVCESCHQGALHYRHLYQKPDQRRFMPCGDPPTTCACCHGEPPDYGTPPVVTERCTSCHSVAATDIVSFHACSPYYHPAPGQACMDCHWTIPGHSLSPEADENDNCDDTLDNDADCAKDQADPDCTLAPSDEICDDGRDNDFDGLIDGHDPDCCGDRVVTPPETCDDGNRIDCDGCSTTCESEFCGDGKQCLALGEECDDGNRTSCDGCSASCREEFCGDGVVCPELGEECDGSAGCPEGFGCDEKCTCRREPAACGATADSGAATERTLGLNLCLLAAPLLFLSLLKRSRKVRFVAALRNGA